MKKHILILCLLVASSAQSNAAPLEEITQELVAPATGMLVAAACALYAFRRAIKQGSHVLTLKEFQSGPFRRLIAFFAGQTLATCRFWSDRIMHDGVALCPKGASHQMHEACMKGRPLRKGVRLVDVSYNQAGEFVEQYKPTLYRTCPQCQSVLYRDDASWRAAMAPKTTLALTGILFFFAVQCLRVLVAQSARNPLEIGLSD